MINNNRGFTMIEILISMVVLVVGLVGVLLVIPLGQKTAGRSALTTRAAILAGEKIEELKTKGYKALTETSFWEGNESPFHWEAVVVDVVEDDFQSAPSIPDEGLLKIDLTVSYKDRGRDQSEVFTTFYSEL